MYKITIKKTASKELNSLPVKAGTKIMEAVYKLADKPRPHGCVKLKGTAYEDLWRIRVGDYRILYAIDDEIKIVDIRQIGDRKDVYR